MKKVFITAILVTGLSVSMFANDGGKKKSSANTVSYAVTNQFSTDFKDATNVVWTVTKNSQKADFMINGQNMTAFYDFTGEYLGVTHAVAYTTLPAQAKKEIAKEYKGYEIGEVIEFQPSSNGQEPSAIYSISYKDSSTVYFVDLKNDREEILVRVTPSADVYFFKQVK